MRYRVSFAGGVVGVELEAAGHHITEGRLMFFAMVAPLVGGPADLEVMIVEYAAGVWRSVAAVGAFTEAVKPPEIPGENSRRR